MRRFGQPNIYARNILNFNPSVHINTLTKDILKLGGKNDIFDQHLNAPFARSDKYVFPVEEQIVFQAEQSSLNAGQHNHSTNML